MMTSIAIMQPYFLPYIGYFQLMNAVDKFVIYDDIQFTKKGWINRNRILMNGKDVYMSLPLKKDSDYLSVKGRHLSAGWDSERIKLLNRIKGAYQKAPFFKEVYPLIEEIIIHEEANLFLFIKNSLESVTKFLSIDTPIIVSSSILFDNNLKAEEKVLDICRAMGADHYINPIGGVDLYDKEMFLEHGVKLSFLKAGAVEYQQLQNEFVPFLSILDVLMFNSVDDINRHIASSFELI